MVQSILLKSEADTEQLAKALLSKLKPSDCILLEGPVGAGKSALARYIIQTQMELDGYKEDVPSPTFTLVQTYETSRGAFWHADLYRLSDQSELEELGLVEALESAISLIEWPERLGALTPDRHLLIKLSFPDNSEDRLVTLLPSGEAWDWIEEVPFSF